MLLSASAQDTNHPSQWKKKDDKNQPMACIHSPEQNVKIVE